MLFDDVYANEGDSVITVTELNYAVAELLEEQIPRRWVRGEISNLTKAASGHWYFTLKDEEGASVRAVMFRMRASMLDFPVHNGLQVEVQAKVTLYVPRGDYQLQVQSMRLAGLGNLHEAFLRIKNQLMSEGLFELERKRRLPPFVRTVGVVTSLGAAALQDVLSALQRRVPHVNVIIYPSLVQGKDAPSALHQALTQAQARQEVDLLLLVRGGGSLEDLWAFNDEALARTISQLTIPLISGVGHETDFTIADFVADLRAPTPTAAAELATLDRDSWLARIERLQSGLVHRTEQLIQNLSLRLDRATSRLISPQHYLNNAVQRNQFLQHRLQKAFDVRLQTARHQYLQVLRHLRQLAPAVAFRERELQQLQHRLVRAAQQSHLQRQDKLKQGLATLQAYNPQAVLKRGFSITYDEAGQIVREASQLRHEQPLMIQLAKGTQAVKVIADKA